MTIEPATPHDSPAFSNSTEGMSWMARWCDRCAHDANVDEDGGCPLVAISMTNKTPAEWVEDKPFSLGEQFRCTYFRPRGEDDPEPKPLPEPDQDGLFDRPCRAARMLRQPHPTLTASSSAPDTQTGGTAVSARDVGTANATGVHSIPTRPRDTSTCCARCWPTTPSSLPATTDGGGSDA